MFYPIHFFLNLLFVGTFSSSSLFCRSFILLHIFMHVGLTSNQ